MAKTGKKAAEQLSKEAREITESLRGPLAGLITTTLDSSYKVFETVTAGVGEIVGTVIDEGARLSEKLRKGVEALSE